MTLRNDIYRKKNLLLHIYYFVFKPRQQAPKFRIWLGSVTRTLDQDFKSAQKLLISLYILL